AERRARRLEGSFNSPLWIRKAGLILDIKDTAFGIACKPSNGRIKIGRHSRSLHLMITECGKVTDNPILCALIHHDNVMLVLVLQQERIDSVPVWKLIERYEDKIVDANHA